MATSQNTRLPEALRPESAPLDDRSVPELLAFAARFGRLVRFHNDRDQPAGDWARFYEDDPLVRLALMGGTDLEGRATFLTGWLRRLQQVGSFPADPVDWPILDTPSEAALRSLFGHWMDGFRAYDESARCFAVPGEEAAFGGQLLAWLDGPLAVARSEARDLWAVARLRYPDALQPLAIEESELHRRTWKAENWADPAATPDSAPARWTEFLSRITALAARLSESERVLVTRARQHLETRLSAPSRLHPHLALYLAFVRQLGHVQARANGITGRHLEFYFRECLKEAPRAAVPDRVHLALTSRTGERPFRLPAGTTLVAPAVGGGNPAVFTTEEPLDITGGELASPGVLRVPPPPAIDLTRTETGTGTSAAPTPSPSPAVTPPTTTPPRPAPVNSPGMPGSGDWGTEARGTWRGLVSGLGLAIGSPCFALRDGIRTIRLQILFAPPPGSIPTPIANSATSPTNPSGPGSGPATTTTAASATASDERLWLAQEAPCRIAYSTESRWHTLPVERIRSYSLRYRDGPNPQALGMNLEVVLEAGDPPMEDWNSGDAADGFARGMPILQLRFADPAEAFGIGRASGGLAEPVGRAFVTARIHQVQIDVAVEDLEAPILYGPTGPIPAGQPFAPFGAAPRVGHAFLLGAPELFRKDFTDLTLRIDWLNLPDPKRYPHGLRSYYREYIQMAGPAGLLDPGDVGYATLADTSDLFQPAAFRVALEYLSGKRWQKWPSSTDSTTPLFQADSQGVLAPSTVIASAAGARFEPNPDPTLPADLRYGPQTVTGFFRLTLAGPDYAFGHLAYPRVAAAVAAHHARLAGTGAGSGQPIVDQIRVTHARSTLGRLAHPGGGPAYYTLPDDLFTALRRAGPPPAELTAQAELLRLPVARLVPRLLRLQASSFDLHSTLDQHVSRTLRLEHGQIEDKDRDHLLALIYAWFAQLLEQQRQLDAALQGLRAPHAPGFFERLRHLGPPPAQSVLPESLFIALAGRPEPPPDLAQLLQSLGLAPASYATHLSGLRGRPFILAEDLNHRLLRALPLPPEAGSTHDLNRLLRLTYEWFVSLTGTGRPLASDGLSMAPSTQPLSMPNPPLNPSAARITLSYRARTTLDASDRPTANRLYHVHPLFTTRLDLTAPTPPTLLPDCPPGTSAFLGLRGVHPGQVVSLLFVPSSTPADFELGETAGPTWAVFAGGRWDTELARSAIRDETHGLKRAGLLRFRVPTRDEVAVEDPGSRPWWVRLHFVDPSRSLPDFAIFAQSTVARRRSSIGPADEPVLAADTGLQLQVPDPRITGILQPLPSFGGRPAEGSRDFHVRVSERLRHKNRAWTAWDYERLLLQEFPEVFFADCLLPGTGESDVTAGSVLIIVLPALWHPPDSLPPGFTAEELAVMQAWLQDRASPHVRIRVANPTYRRIAVSAAVRFRLIATGAALLERLNEELRQHLSPWVYQQRAVQLPDRAIARSTVARFISTRSYVDALEQVELLSQPMAPTAGVAGESEWIPAGARISTTRPSEHLLTTDRHPLRST